MCFAVYIGTNEEQEIGEFVPEKTDIYFEHLTEEELEGLRPKFSNPYLYYVGSDTGCSCGLQFDSKNYNDPNEEINKKSPKRFLEFINQQTLKENLEFYCCWEGDWNDPIEEKIEIDIRTISLDKNYFGLKERQFILFKKQEKPLANKT
ncbi:hypothetical protein [Adhaeribacter soli]|uniref:Uncharacterized protein n=1 Tax=Adhaeribacter soli TaxID=2607655 RepID=A0A5N1J1G2_9BACT|nr:hypothetical protein [Adhaeribacter soli]KAA9340264.1 hypothetical protein F0P94_07920 [Adhaeribacter soli]